MQAGWKWVNASDGVLGSLTKQWTQRIERAMTTKRVRRGEYLGFVDDMHFWNDRIVGNDGVRLMDEHVRATVETGGQLLQSKRPTLTRMAVGAVLPGTALIPGLAFQKTEIKDLREVYLVVEHPEWARMVRVNPAYTQAVREVAMRITQAAREIASRNQPAATSEPVESGESPLDQLKKLGALHAAGVLTDEEFATQKARLLERLSES